MGFLLPITFKLNKILLRYHESDFRLWKNCLVGPCAQVQDVSTYIYNVYTNIYNINVNNETFDLQLVYKEITKVERTIYTASLQITEYMCKKHSYCDI